MDYFKQTVTDVFHKHRYFEEKTGIRPGFSSVSRDRSCFVLQVKGRIYCHAACVCVCVCCSERAPLGSRSAESADCITSLHQQIYSADHWLHYVCQHTFVLVNLWGHLLTLYSIHPINKLQMTSMTYTVTVTLNLNQVFTLKQPWAKKTWKLDHSENVVFQKCPHFYWTFC